MHVHAHVHTQDREERERERERGNVWKTIINSVPIISCFHRDFPENMEEFDPRLPRELTEVKA